MPRPVPYVIPVIFVLLGIASSAVLAQQVPYDQTVEVSARKAGEQIIIDVNMLVPATQSQTWDVLVDYDHMSQFLPNLQVSKILSQSKSQLRVMQKGGVTHGPLSINFDVVRDVQLNAYQEIDAHVISGNLKKVDSSTRLSQENAVTRLRFHSESIPNVWVPPGIGTSLIENETRDQFSALRAEIVKRQAFVK